MKNENKMADIEGHNKTISKIIADLAQLKSELEELESQGVLNRYDYETLNPWYTRQMIQTPINYYKVKEDNENEYLIPEYPLCACAFDELPKKCRELERMLKPQGIVWVYTPNFHEIDKIPAKIRNCGVPYWTSSTHPDGDQWAVRWDGVLDEERADVLLGFRPILIKQKQK